MLSSNVLSMLCLFLDSVAIGVAMCQMLLSPRSFLDALALIGPQAGLPCFLVAWAGAGSASTCPCHQRFASDPWVGSPWAKRVRERGQRLALSKCVVT